MPHSPDPHLYNPLFYPWGDANAEFQKWYRNGSPITLVSVDRAYALITLLRQSLGTDGDVWECGVYKGGSASMIAGVMSELSPSKKLRLFDTFSGMPASDPNCDAFKAGDLGDSSEEMALANIGHPELLVVHKGTIPTTFSGLEDSRICFAHIDVDIYQSTMDCMKFIYPRVSKGGILVCDDYGFPECYGARKAVDEFCSSSGCVPFSITTGQAVIFKSIA